MRIFGPRTKYTLLIPTDILMWSRNRPCSPICGYKGRYPARCRRHFARVSRKHLTNFWKIPPLTPQESVEHVCSGTKTKIRVEDKRYPEPLRDQDISGKSIKLTTWPDWPTAIDCHTKQHALLPTRNFVLSSPKRWPWRDHPRHDPTYRYRPPLQPVHRISPCPSSTCKKICLTILSQLEVLVSPLWYQILYFSILTTGWCVCNQSSCCVFLRQ